MNEAYVLVDDHDAVRTLTLHNPARRNAWNLHMEAEYFARLDDADADPSVRVIVVTGSEGAFCPGMDVQRLAGDASTGSLQLGGRRPQSHPLRIRKPMVAAINGAAAGIGLYQALVCDVRFVASTARLSTAYARRGLPAEYGTSWILPRLIGVEAALDLLLSARVFTGEEAGRLGLASRVTEAATVLAEAQAYAADLATNCSPMAMGAIRRQIWGDLSRRFDDAVVQALALQGELMGARDFAEGVASFAEKRSPRFVPLEPDWRVPGDRGYA